MQRLLIVAPLAEGTHMRATELLAHGPPFDPGSTNLDRHAVYLTESEVVFAFDGSDVEWEVDDLAEESFPGVEAAIERWRELLAGRRGSRARRTSGTVVPTEPAGPPNGPGRRLGTAPPPSRASTRAARAAARR